VLIKLSSSIRVKAVFNVILYLERDYTIKHQYGEIFSYHGGIAVITPDTVYSKRQDNQIFLKCQDVYKVPGRGLYVLYIIQQYMTSDIGEKVYIK